jgi:ABC-type transport system involved in cytochrome c biogenesis permease component
MEYWLIYCGLVLYLISTLVAWWRSHHQVMAIVALNLLLGWTVLGWIGALIWALTTVHRGAEGR